MLKEENNYNDVSIPIIEYLEGIKWMSMIYPFYLTCVLIFCDIILIYIYNGIYSRQIQFFVQSKF